MDRRDFLKLASLTGMSLVFPPAIRGAAAQEGGYSGNFYVLVHAGGGWDPTSHCDPKGFLNGNPEDPDRLNNYAREDILTAGNLQFAPIGNNQYFFEKYYDRLLVLNGVDTETNSHDAGARNTWSGRLAEGQPSLGAMLASAIGPDRPMAFQTAGGYDFTAGLIGPTRVGNTNTLLRIAWPNLQNPDDEESGYHTPATWQRIREAQSARLGRLIQTQRLPRIQNAMSLLFLARSAENELRRLSEFLPDQLDNSSQLRRQAQVALAGYMAGVSVSANLSMGGFDTHGNHDQNHFPRLEQLFDGVDFLMEEAARLGVADKIVVVMGSDFGRTPGYNENQGKDHWSISSMMMMGPGIPGNRVIGSTNDGHRPISIDPVTLASDERGIRIKPAHVHAAIRRLAGIYDSVPASAFPLFVEEELPLFG